MFVHNCIDRVAFGDFAVSGRYAYFCNIYFAGLFELDIYSLDCRLIDMLPADEPMASFRYSGIDVHDGRIVLSPYFADRILINDIKINETISVFMDDYYSDRERVVLGNVYIREKKAFVFPITDNRIFIVDIDAKEIKKVITIKRNGKDESKDNRLMSWGQPCFENGTIAYIPAMQDNFILRFDMDSYSYDFISIEGISYIGSITLFKNTLLIGDRERLVILNINKEGKIIDRINLQYNGLISRKGIKNIFVYGNRLFIIPSRSNMILRFDVLTREVVCVKPITMEYQFGIYEIGEDVIKCCKQIGDEAILFYSSCDGKIVRINMKTGEIVEKDAIVRDDDKKSICQFMTRDLINESKEFGLYEYLNVL